jgi:uncharacterized protein YqeY
VSALRDRIQADLTEAMRSRDQVRTGALRLALAAIATEATAGKAARQLSDEEVVALLRREVRRREEAADAFTAGGRPDRAERERAEQAVLAAYLPAALSGPELAGLVAAAIAEVAPAGGRSAGLIGPVMKALGPRVAGRAAGARVAAEVRRQLG